MVVGFLRTSRPEHEQPKRAIIGERRLEIGTSSSIPDSSTARVPRPAADGDPRGVAERERERFSERGQHPNDRQRCRKRWRGFDLLRSPPTNGTDHRKRRFAGHVTETLTNSGMQRLVDPVHHGRRNRIEIRGASDFIGNVPKQALSVVSLPEEPAVDSIQPALAVRACHQQRRTQEAEPPPARPNDDQ